ncbi:MAG: hypothetical protein HY695_00345 [Deltaproteobacteria bacterium]|nr:hypothetical protein [Deltaproteobacteria bacterium]
MNRLVKLRRLWWTPWALLPINLAALGLVMLYSYLNLRPYTPPMIPTETARRVGDRFRLRSLGSLTLKNITTPVEAWEVCDDNST